MAKKQKTARSAARSALCEAIERWIAEGVDAETIEKRVRWILDVIEGDAIAQKVAKARKKENAPVESK